MKDEEKKEKMNELMNRISLALKDASLAQGFEIICKRISELEKENKISEEIIIGEQQEINELKKEKARLENTDNEQTDLILKLYEQYEKMKSDIEDLIKVQSLCIEDDYNAGLLNGLITTYNSIFEERFLCCKWNEHKNKWEMAE